MNLPKDIDVNEELLFARNNNGTIEMVVYKLRDFTCCFCPENHTCKSAFDLYNTNGDCLENK